MCAPLRIPDLPTKADTLWPHPLLNITRTDASIAASAESAFTAKHDPADRMFYRDGRWTRRIRQREFLRRASTKNAAQITRLAAAFWQDNLREILAVQMVLAR